MPPPIPDRWLPYKACGRIIEGTRFICFKVPLKKSVQMGRSEIREIWDIQALLEKVPKLGAVIDLTNTGRYYDPKELLDSGILHKKIYMPGHVIPPEKKVQEFMDTVDEFLGKDCEFLVGVHCTHGLNRTGYMVCRYMRDRLKIPAKDAIKKFEKARGYQIERDNYIADILGTKPQAPDLGNSTELRPARPRDSMSYRSPLNDYEESEYSGNRYGSRPSYSNRNKGNSSGSQHGTSYRGSNDYNYKYDY